MSYTVATSLAEALTTLNVSGGQVIAGGTDVFPSMAPGHPPHRALDITRIEGLRGIRRVDDGWRIGAATTWTDVVRADLPPAFDALKQAALQVGSAQIQNRATLAGNICNASPAADGVPPLLALDAHVEVSGLEGARTMPLRQFVQGVRKTALKDGELVSALHIPSVAGDAGSAFEKLGARKYLVISIAMVAAVATVRDGRITDARVAVGSCSPVAERLDALERQLEGMAVADLRDAQLEDPALLTPLDPISDVRGSAAYRLDVVCELCRRAVLRACGEEVV